MAGDRGPTETKYGLQFARAAPLSRRQSSYFIRKDIGHLAHAVSCEHMQARKGGDSRSPIFPTLPRKRLISGRLCPRPESSPSASSMIWSSVLGPGNNKAGIRVRNLAS
eukprot:580546-Pelagomonas_calceolata.AAC.2